MNAPRAAVIDGKGIAAKLRAEVAAEAKELVAAGWKPSLMSISVGDAAAAEIYVRNQRKQAESAGVSFESCNYPAEISLEQLVGVIQGLNADPNVNGIIIQRPLPAHIPVKNATKGGASVEGCRGNAPRLDRQYRLQRSGAGAVHRSGFG